ncbi:hypothetical protein [Parapedobacter lycopersici]|uniref:hypothetical protein n=1 Tax=Parapedobacter lycopersici TaxID=1864939 RepID=UPI00214D5B62|nr:hypothetical protein [Parapedobacter lycopersici]
MIGLYLLILVIGAVASYIGPWWAIAPVCFILCWWKGKTAVAAYWISATGGVSIWLVYALYLHAVAEVDLSNRVAGIFLAGLGADGIPGIIPLTFLAVLIIGLVSGFSGLAGIRARSFINRPQQGTG